MPELNRTQFQDHVHPHQLALPGMEHLAHPFATHLARGYMLDYAKSLGQHHLTAVDMSDPKWPEPAADLDWAHSKNKGYSPGEVAMVQNYQEGTTRGRGLAGALFHSAHHFNLGQDTVPVHSPQRSAAGERFSQKVRPDLRPDVWRNYHEGVEVSRASGKPSREAPKWPGVGEEFHPYQQKKAARRRAESAKAHEKVKRVAAGHRRLPMGYT